MHLTRLNLRHRLARYMRERDRGWVLSLLAAVCLLYLPFLGSPFIFDDLNLFVGGIAKQYAHAWPNLALRALPYATLGWTQLAFSAVRTHFYHLGNLLFHAANVVMLFFLLRRLAGPLLPGQERAVKWGAWLGALVFALHPVSVYAVGYVVQRTILMAVFFSLIAQLAYLRGLFTGKRAYLLLSAAAYFMAVFSKEHSVLLPLVLAAETLLLYPQLRANLQRMRPYLWLTWAAYIATGLLVIVIAKGVWGTAYEPMSAALFHQEGVHAHGGTLHLESILLQMALFFRYLFLWIVPNPAWMSIDMRMAFPASLSALQGWLGAAFFLLWGYAGLRLLLRRGRAGLLGFAMLYPWLQFVLEFSTIRVQEPFVLYRSYLWMPGLMLVFPLILDKWRSKAAVPALLGLALLFSAGAANRLWVMADNYRLWNDAVLLLPNDKVPGADRILFNRGQAEAGRGRLKDAIADFRRSLAVSPQYAPVHFQLGWTLLRLHRLDEAQKQFDQAIALDPKFPDSYFGKGMVLKLHGKPAEAIKYMQKACKLNVAMACLLLGKKVTNTTRY